MWHIKFQLFEFDNDWDDLTFTLKIFLVEIIVCADINEKILNNVNKKYLSEASLIGAFMIISFYALTHCLLAYFGYFP